MRLYLIICMTGWLGAMVHAVDVPDLINYQGRLLDDTGVPLGGAREAVFGLYDEPAGGDALWVQQTTVHADSNGLFNVTLGGTTNSLLAAVGSQFDALYLDMAFKVGNVMEAVRPRQQFVSVAYAQLAENIANVQDFDVTGDLTVRQAALGALTTEKTMSAQFTANNLTTPGIQLVTNITSSTGQVITIDSQVVFHGLTTKGQLSLSALPGSVSPDNVFGGAYYQPSSDVFLNFSGIAKASGNHVIIKICPTRPVNAQGQYVTPNDTAVNSGLKSFESHQSTVTRTELNTGLCIPVPAGWWVGCYAYNTVTGSSYHLVDYFSSVQLQLISGL